MKELGFVVVLSLGLNDKHHANLSANKPILLTLVFQARLYFYRLKINVATVKTDPNANNQKQFDSDSCGLPGM